MGRTILTLCVVVGLTTVPLHWIVPELSLLGWSWGVWLMVAVVGRLLLLSHQKHGGGFGLMALIVRYGCHYSANYQGITPDRLRVIRPVMVIVPLLVWFRTRWRIWFAVIVVAALWGLLMSVPRQHSTRGAQDVQSLISPMKTYRTSPQEDQSLVVSDGENITIVKKNTRTPHTSTKATYTYASTNQDVDGVAVIHLDDTTTIGMQSQSLVDIEKQLDNTRHIHLKEGSMTRYQGRTAGLSTVTYAGNQSQKITGSFGGYEGPSIDTYHKKNQHTIAQTLTRLRPSPWIDTTIGASIVRIKILVLSMVMDTGHDIQQLYRYQCLLYNNRCDHIEKNREWRAGRSLSKETLDTGLQSTLQDATEFVIEEVDTITMP